MLPLVSPDAVLIVPPSMSAEPDVYEGHEGARRYFAGFDGVIEEVRYRVRELHDESAERVLAEMEVTGVGAGSGIPIALDSVLECRFRDGRLVRAVAHPDLETARAA